MKRMLPLIAMCLLASSARAAVKTEIVEYKAGDAVMQGWVSWDAAKAGRRPGVLLVHDWMGATAHQKSQAEQLAAKGYVVFVADAYGKGVRPTTAKDASAEAGKYYANRGLLRARLRAALDLLAARPQVDGTRLATIGYCFGGMGALELARSGAPLRAVVTFHGSLAAENTADAKNIRAKVLVLHGAADGFVAPADKAAFEQELTAAKVDWQLVEYGGAVHCFTDRGAGADPSKGCAYDAAADARSWAAMRTFFAELFAKKP